MNQPEKTTPIQLIASEEAEPPVERRTGKRYEVAVVPIVDRDLNAVEEGIDETLARPPRLCGSRSTCIAIIEIE
jgi:hypothetical protein